MNAFFRAALVIYLVATGLGELLRTSMVIPVEGLSFGNGVHAHSHTLYFGWAALGLFALFFARVGAHDVAVKRALGSVVLLSLATFAAFLHSGYRAPGIAVSTLSLAVWAFAAKVFLARAKALTSMDATFLRVGIAYIGVAGLSAAVRVALLVAKVEDPLYGRLAVFGFLRAFATFFEFGLMGLLVHHLSSSGARLDTRALRWQLGFMVPLSALTFPLGVRGGMDSVFGPTARLAAVLLLVSSFLWVRQLWHGAKALPGSERAFVVSLAAAWALKALLEVAGALGLAESAVAARHPAMLYVHLELLGIVTAGLFFLMRKSMGTSSTTPLWAHQGGVLVMLTGLGLSGAHRLGLAMAAVGGALVWLSGAWVAHDAFRAGALESVPPS